jgi:polysaccharide export outer membrane protein
MTNSNRAHRTSSRAVGKFFLALAGLAFAGAAAAQGADKLSLRLSSDLTLGGTPPPAAPAPVKGPELAPVASGTSLTMRDYRIGPEDLLEVQVFGVDQLTRTVRVNGRGLISLPLIGNVEVAGLTAQQAEALVVKKLGESYLQDPQVSLFIKEYTSQRVIIEGAVNKPGVYPLRGPTTLLQSLAIAGGQGSLSDMAEVMLFRTEASGAKQTFTFDVDKIRSGQVPDPVVLNEDMIVVKRSPGRILLRDSILGDIINTVNPFRW